MLSPENKIQPKCSNPFLCCFSFQRSNSTPLLSSLLNISICFHRTRRTRGHSLEILKIKTAVHSTHQLSVSTSSRTSYVSIMKTNRFVLRKEIFADYYKNQN